MRALVRKIGPLYTRKEYIYIYICIYIYIYIYIYGEREPGLAYRVKCRYLLTFLGKWTSVVGEEWGGGGERVKCFQTK